MAIATDKPTAAEIAQAEAEAAARAGAPDPPEPSLDDLPPLERKARLNFKKDALEAVRERKRILKENGIGVDDDDVANKTIGEVKESLPKDAVAGSGGG